MRQDRCFLVFLFLNVWENYSMKIFVLSLAFLVFLLLPLGCSSSSSPVITTGILTGIITDIQTSTAIPGVRITIYYANSNAPVGGSFTTASDGSYGVELQEGTYYVKLSKQGYEQVPPKDISPLPINIPRNQTIDYSVQMFQSSITNAGSISGRVMSNGSSHSGVFVVASKSVQGFSSVTDGGGNFFIYNVPPDTYSVKGWIAGFTSTDTTVVVIANEVISNLSLKLTAGGTGAVDGQISLNATTNTEVDVALTDPNTRETIPGLSIQTINRNYVITSVPPGIYLARATFANDGKVMDPNWIIKNGQPYVSVGVDTVTRDFTVTGAAELIGPTNPSSSTQPVEIIDTLPIFSWNAYSSADHYIIEVINASGKVIWGGFSNNWNVRNVIIPKTQTNIRFNADSSATETLMEGKVYRWNIYVSKDDSGEPNGWKLISASEDQRGLFKVIP